MNCWRWTQKRVQHIRCILKKDLMNHLCFATAEILILRQPLSLFTICRRSFRNTFIKEPKPLDRTHSFFEENFFSKKIDVFGSHFAHPHFPCITSIQLKFFPSHPLRVSRILSVWFVFRTKRFDWNWIMPNALRARACVCVCDVFKLFFPLKTDKKPRSTKYSLTLIVG